MPNLALASALTFFAFNLTLASTPFHPPSDGTIGSHLEAFTNIRLSAPAPTGGTTIVVTSDDPSRLLVSGSIEQAGSSSLTLTVPARQIETPEFYLQAVGSPGSVSYTVSSPGSDAMKGTIKIADSAILIGGPSKALQFKTTKATPRKLTVYTAVLDDAGNVIDKEQPVAGGLSFPLNITSSDPKVGAVTGPPIVLKGGEISVKTQFNPSSPGTAVLTASVPPGFKAASKGESVTIEVDLPGLALLGDITVGKNLQVLGYVLLGEDAPAGGVDVTVTSDDPTKLVISKSDEELGSKSITLHIPEGEGRAQYFVQALADAGTVNYIGVANGYHSRPTPIDLAPSGLMVVFAPYGPPDEGEFLRPMPTTNYRPLFASLSDHKSVWITIWSVYLDPITHRGADITAQRLRPGLSVKVDLTNSDPSIAKTTDSVVLTSKSVCAFAEFHPLKAGGTVIAVKTPQDFATPSNGTTIEATVVD